MNSRNIIIALLVLIAIGGYFALRGGSTAGAPAPVEAKESVASTAPVKEFSMTAYYDAKGKWYSLNEMSVKKGDLVRVKITNTAGMHDFVIDEFGVQKELPLNQEVVVEFTADKVGSFVYYCSKPGHRAGGQWGTLVVSE
ncbi:MAG TPA: cupredoxin domain-containing protein [Candidatus Paceibacterota bacterium]|nr:cupredoxin domain-containing protein [Candidatus Paceibacterota bacterium]